MKKIMKRKINKRKNLNGHFFNYKKMLLFCVIIFVIMLSFGETYSLFMKVFVQKSSNQYQTGNLNIEFNSLSSILTPLPYPLSDDDGINTDGYTFDIINSGTLNYNFNLKLQDMDNGTIDCSSGNYIICYLKVQLNDEEPILVSSDNDFTVKSGLTISNGTRIGMNLKIWLDESAPNSLIGKNFHGNLVIDGVAVVTYRGLANELYNNGEMVRDNTDGKNYRYQGGGCREIEFESGEIVRSDCSNVNNYVRFNNELWRIVGIFNVSNGAENQDMMKIVRESPLPEPKYWNSNISIIGYDYLGTVYNTLGECQNIGYDDCNPIFDSGSSDFGSATIKDYLNGNTEGNYYYSLNSDAKNMISNVVWNVGGISWYNINTANDLYIAERNTDYYQCVDEDGDGFDDGPVGVSMDDLLSCGDITSTYNMNVGFIYPSDYILASSSFYCFMDIKSTDCQKNNWLNTFDDTELLMSPTGDIEEYITIMEGSMCLIGGEITSMSVTNLSYIRPSVYLKENILITGGNGTNNNPYIIKQNNIS